MKFEMTPEGYKKAKSYLENECKMQLLDFEQSEDGFTVVALANSIYKDLADKSNDLQVE